MNKKSFIFIGRSGCGKGTQAKLLSDYLKKTDPNRDVLYIQSGGEIREFIKGDSETQRISKKIYQEDKLQPEFLAVYMWVNVLIKKYTGNEHLIFDGSPRKADEANILNSIFDFYGLDSPFVIFLDISEESVTKRLALRGRMDDSKNGIEKRLAWYSSEVMPALDFYRNNKKYTFLTIDGERLTEEIHKDIVSKI
ncbi:MAG: nucleoside monophosphate kinase [Patescibacteria group bacterium]